jgi:O-antigen ligase
LWLCLWAPLLALAWLLPNHYYPWATFHSDAWVAVLMALVTASVTLQGAQRMQWHGLTLPIALLLPLPFLQYFVGILFFSGQAWVSSAFVVGLLLALLIGARWENTTPGRAADGLFIAIGIAAFVSVGLQLRQWLGMGLSDDPMQIWAEEFSPGRPSANLGQPNQLATLLLWGLLACVWGMARQQLRGRVAALASLYLLFGIVLTQSRIAFISIVVLTAATWIWRRWLPPRAPLVATLLLLYFIVCTSTLQFLSDAIGLNQQIRSATWGGESTHLRLEAYALFLDAVQQQPWWGYGWNQLVVAQMAVAQNHPSLATFFMHSHNLFLDLVLWCGIPIGALISYCILVWVVSSLGRVSNLKDGVLLMFVVVVGLHAMVELPLHHAYFLLPTGLVVGILNHRLRHRVVFSSSRWVVFGVWLAASLLLGIITRDYLQVDASARTLRLDAARIGRQPAGLPPDVLLLNDLRESIRYARLTVEPNISTEELTHLRKVAYVSATPYNLFNVAKALAYLGQPEEAQAWIAKMQKVQPDGFDGDLRRIWESQAKTQPAMAAVQWPPATPRSQGAHQLNLR